MAEYFIGSGYALLAFFWLACLALLNYTGVARKAVVGPQLLVAGSAFAIFTAAFKVLVDVVTVGESEAGLISNVNKIGVYIGGTLAWILGMLGALAIVAFLAGWIKR